MRYNVYKMRDDWYVFKPEGANRPLPENGHFPHPVGIIEADAGHLLPGYVTVFGVIDATFPGRYSGLDVFMKQSHEKKEGA